MRVEFDSKVRKYFEDYSKMKKTMGDELTKIVKKRMNQIEASENLYAYLSFGIGKPHWLEGEFENCIGVRINGNKRLIISINIINKDVETLKLCDFVIVKGVGDYHGKGNKTNWIIP